MSSDEEHELTRVHRQERAARLRRDLDLLRGRRARSNDPATRARLDERIRVAERRLAGAQ